MCSLLSGRTQFPCNPQAESWVASPEAPLGNLPSCLCLPSFSKFHHPAAQTRMQDEDQRAGVQFWLLPHAQQAMTDQFCRISTQLFCLKIAHLQQTNPSSDFPRAEEFCCECLLVQLLPLILFPSPSHRCCPWEHASINLQGEPDLNRLEFLLHLVGGQNVVLWNHELLFSSKNFLFRL